MPLFQDAVAQDFADLNDLIVRQLYSDVDLVENIGHYLVNAGGKRLRPLLVLLCSNAFNVDKSEEHHLLLATIIEFIHTATLLHDDVVDLSTMRRGRPTANAKWGNAPSVLVGDFLYSRAFQLMVAMNDMTIMRILADTTNTISEGEVQQLVNARNPEVSEANYFSVIYKKTAALFEAACETAAVLCNATEEQRKAAKLYGKNLGIAYQLVDDLLDYEGDADVLGKNVGDDLAEGKPTLPLILSIHSASQADSTLIKDSIRDGGLENLDAVIQIVRSTGALETTRLRAQEAIAEAKQQLTLFPVNQYRDAMEELADFALARTN